MNEAKHCILETSVRMNRQRDSSWQTPLDEHLRRTRKFTLIPQAYQMLLQNSLCLTHFQSARINVPAENHLQSQQILHYLYYALDGDWNTNIRECLMTDFPIWLLVYDSLSQVAQSKAFSFAILVARVSWFTLPMINFRKSDKNSSRLNRNFRCLA